VVSIGFAVLGVATSAAEGTRPPAQRIPAAAQTRVDTVIQSMAARQDGAEYREYRQWASADLDGDGRSDWAVLYTIEVGNDYTRYLLVAINEGNTFQTIGPVVVGGRGKRFVSFDSLGRNRIHLHTRAFKWNDAMCCPSVEGNTTFVLQDGQLQEERARSEPACTADHPCGDD
jgi:hypothetical protein